MLWLVALCVAPALGAGVAGCDMNTVLNTTIFNDLHARLAAETNSIVRQEVWDAFINNKTNLAGQGFSGEQSLAILELFPNSITVSEIIAQLGPYQLGLTCSEVETLMLTVSNSFTRMDILKATVNSIINLKTHNETLLGAFTNSFSKDEAREVIAGAKPISCVWGDVHVVQRMIFVVDVSGSMGATFKDDAGATVTRLQFVSQQLKQTLQTELELDQEFNIIKFSSGASGWEPGVVPASPENIQQAASYASALSPGGSTNMLAGLQLAFKDPAAQGIYLLSDGAPDQSTSQIVTACVSWSKANGNAPIFPIAFMAGSGGQWMIELAKLTGGTFRNIVAP